MRQTVIEGGTEGYRVGVVDGCLHCNDRGNPSQYKRRGNS
jgi:hypothetical protein